MKSQVAWSVPLTLAAVLLILGPLLAHGHIVAPIVGFMMFAASLVPGLIAVFLALYLIFKGRKRQGVLSLAVGAIPLLIILGGMVKSRSLPRINDISTNLDNPPALSAAAAAPDNAGKDLSYPEAFKSQVQDSYPDLISLQLPLPPPEAFALVQKVASAQPTWTITKTEAMKIEGEDTAGLFQFTDDFAIRVLPVAGASQVDMRSRSRVGKGDFGANAKRIRAFFEAVQKDLQPQPAASAGPSENQ